MRLRALIPAIVCTSSVLLALPSASNALTCAVDPEYRPYHDSDVVFDAVALSGPTTGEGLVTPARFHVFRYLKGSGPRRVRMETGVRPTDLLYSQPLLYPFAPRPGHVWRIYLATSTRASRIDGSLGDPGPCNPHRVVRRSRYLRRVANVVVERGGEEPQRAFATQHSSGVRCLHVSYSADCAGRRSTRPLLARAASGREGHASTGIAVLAPGLQAMTVETSGERVEASVTKAGLGLAALPGSVGLDDVRIRVRYQDGREDVLDDAMRRGLSVADPLDGTAWKVEVVTTRGRPAVTCARVRPFANWYDGGTCGRLDDAAFFFGVNEVRLGEEETARRTVVAGAGTNALASVSVAGPDGERLLPLTDRGRGFLAIFGSDVTFRELTVTARFADGSSETYAGRTGVNVAR